jgi:hypothetical protein
MKLRFSVNKPDTREDTEMNKKLMNYLTGSILLLFTSGASAVVIDVGTLNLDVTEGSFLNVIDAAGESGVYWNSAFIAIEPVTVNQGDTFNVGFEFLNGQSLELISGAYNTGREIFQYRQVTPPVSNHNTSTVSFTGVGGSLNSPGMFSSTGTAGFFNGTVSDNATDTSFSFHDIHFQTDFLSLAETELVSSLQLRVVATDINAYTSIPEPTSITLLGLGLAGLGFGCRKKAV